MVRSLLTYISVISIIGSAGREAGWLNVSPEGNLFTESEDGVVIVGGPRVVGGMVSDRANLETDRQDVVLLTPGSALTCSLCSPSEAVRSCSPRSTQDTPFWVQWAAVRISFELIKLPPQKGL